MEKDYDIFISYRRDTGATSAQILKSELTRLGYRVFLDTDDLPHVGIFDHRIYDAIASAPVFLFVYSKGCLDRCVNPDDWIALEIQRAVELRRIIIPLNEDSALKYYPFPPKEIHIPEAIRNGLGQHQFLDFFTGQFKRHSIDDLKNGLDSLSTEIRNLKKEFASQKPDNDIPPTPSVQSSCTLKIRSNDGCSMMVDGEHYALIKADTITKVDIPYGCYFIGFAANNGTRIDDEEYTIDTPSRTISLTFPAPQTQPAVKPSVNPSVKPDMRLVLVSAGKMKLSVVKCVKELLGIGLKEAKEFVDHAPSVFPSYDIATNELIKTNLESLGAKLKYN